MCYSIPSFGTIIAQPQNTSVCIGGNTSISTNALTATNFQWKENGLSLSNNALYSGVTTATLNISGVPASLSGKKYSCVLSDDCTLPTVSDSAVLTVNPLPVFGFTILPDSCRGGGSATVVHISGAAPYTYSWTSFGNQTQTVYFGTSSQPVVVTDANGCAASGTAVINLIAAAPEPICLATVDSLSQHNVIVWEKPVTAYIDSFRIYREDATNIFTYVASIDYAAFSEYTDTSSLANPLINSKRYKMATKDVCGQVSALSKWHNTILLSDQQNGNFSWNFYEVEGQTSSLVSQYILQRYDSASTSWTTINTTAGTQNTMIAPGYNTHQYSLYRVLSDLGSYGCTPTARIATGVNNTRSNIKNKLNPNAVYANKRFENQIILQPNPASDMVQLISNIELESIRVMDNLGRSVLYQKLDMTKSKRTELSLSVLASGVYTVICKGKDFEVRKKLVVE